MVLLSVFPKAPGDREWSVFVKWKHYDSGHLDMLNSDSQSVAGARRYQRSWSQCQNGCRQQQTPLLKRAITILGGKSATWPCILTGYHIALVLQLNHQSLFLKGSEQWLIQLAYQAYSLCFLCGEAGELWPAQLLFCYANHSILLHAFMLHCQQLD